MLVDLVSLTVNAKALFVQETGGKKIELSRRSRASEEDSRFKIDAHP